MIDFSRNWAVLYEVDGNGMDGIVSNLDLSGYDVITVGTDDLPKLTVDDRDKLLSVDKETILVVDLDRTDSYDVKVVGTIAMICRSRKLRLLLFSSRDLTELGQDYVNIYANCSLVVKKQKN